MKIIRFITLVLCTLISSIALAQNSKPAADADGIKTSAVKVKGVTCKNDLKTIADNVEKLKGVSACKADKAGPTTTFQIKFNPALVSEKDIFAAIEDTPGCEDPKDRPYKVKK